MEERLSLLGVYAHPDDEQGITGSLIKYGRSGARTGLICATRGEAGEIAPDTEATADALGCVREMEMRCAAQLAGVDDLYFLDYRDSGMAGTPENADLRSLHQAPVLKVAEEVTRIVRMQRPQVILTFDPWGGYGHPDHIKIHQAALIAYFAASDSRAFPDQITSEGLTPWTPLKVYYGAFSRSRFQRYFESMIERGEQVPENLVEFLSRAVPDEAITTRIDVQEFADLKLQALKCHATQLGPNTFFAKLPAEVTLERMREETFVLAESRVKRPQGLETDLFAGIPS